ncbi:MAG: helix-turn-helix transcriptional regulator, partial [Nocardioidaceae bacterium]|nr:helix-turn-helix transcriptional regulator [Nocardioidaceae bacterium]
REHHDSDRPPATDLARAWVAVERRDPEGARRLLDRAATHPSADPLLGWASTLLRSRLGAAPGPDADGPPYGQALSAKELEVLNHLAALLSTEEIAAAMFISVNTVKTHVRSILRKLAVSRRNQAVRRAQQLGLV